ncbi:MAG: glycerol-3-phosphate 1-O-acyltransferase PlsY [Acidaminococcaceae bacterium]|nr:glycerol-3-phosphate 1-O-acyltransferase PlsY [Acidaminococcaceae bacterium]
MVSLHDLTVLEPLALPIVECLLLGYIFGSVPSGLWIVQALHHIDIREYGSHNIGSTNVFRTVGARTAALVLFSDAFKGIVACFIANYLFHMNFLTVICAIGTILGHNYSLFLGLKGGKGVATGLGLLIYLMPDVCAISLAVWGVIVFFTRYVSLASIAAAAIGPFLGWYLHYPRSYIALSAICGLFIIIRHKENILRLIHGTESKIKMGNPKKFK